MVLMPNNLHKHVGHEVVIITHLSFFLCKFGKGFCPFSFEQYYTKDAKQNKKNKNYSELHMGFFCLSGIIRMQLQMEEFCHCFHCFRNFVYIKNVCELLH